MGARKKKNRGRARRLHYRVDVRELAPQIIEAVMAHLAAALRRARRDRARKR